MKQLKWIVRLLCVGGFLAGHALAQSPVTVTISPQAAGAAIRDDFIGLSFGMRSLPPGEAGGHFFSPTNAPLVTLFQNLGVRHLRLGGTTVESPPATPIPGTKEIDDLFAFAKAADVGKIIYSLRLLETNAALHYAETNAAIAKYIWDHYRSQLEYFAIGNEPDLHRVYKQDFAVTNFGSYLEKWRRFASAITNAVPDAKFAGPDAAGSASWPMRFADEEKDAGLIGVVAAHYYVGGAGRGVSAEQGINDMLSPEWPAKCQNFYETVTKPALADGLGFRFTEANDHYSGGAVDASDTFAGALWALDFLHWWAAHDASGVNFHNTQWVVNDIITRDADHRLTIYPKGYGLKAFDLGGHGRIEPAAISNPDGVNLTAYAVGGAGEHFVTLINKEHGPGARAAKAIIAAPGTAGRAEVIFLAAADGDAAAKTGVTLGGAAINADGPWAGKWSQLPADKSGQCTVKVPAASAAIVKIPAR